MATYSPHILYIFSTWLFSCKLGVGYVPIRWRCQVRTWVKRPNIGNTFVFGQGNMQKRLCKCIQMLVIKKKNVGQGDRNAHIFIGRTVKCVLIYWWLFLDIFPGVGIIVRVRICALICIDSFILNRILLHVKRRWCFASLQTLTETSVKWLKWLWKITVGCCMWLSYLFRDSLAGQVTKWSAIIRTPSMRFGPKLGNFKDRLQCRSAVKTLAIQEL